MTKQRDPYWDELGIAWSAIETDTSAIMPRLQSRLRRQALIITAVLALGAPLTMAGFVIGVITIWSGSKSGSWNFITRGSAIVIISAIAAKAVCGLLPVRSSSDGKPLWDMLALAVARSQQTLAMIRLGIVACAIAAIFGLIGTAIRYSSGRPPALSPVIDTGVLAIVALVLILYMRQVKVSLAKLQYLRRAVTSDLPPERDGK